MSPVSPTHPGVLGRTCMIYKEKSKRERERVPLDREAYQAAVYNIRTDAVADVVNHYNMSTILGVHPSHCS